MQSLRVSRELRDITRHELTFMFVVIHEFTAKLVYTFDNLVNVLVRNLAMLK